MGLDMYVFKMPKQFSEHEVFITNPDDSGSVILNSAKFSTFEEVEKTLNVKHEEILYWRKFNALHGWMEKWYISKGGNQEFNCVHMPITNELLDELSEDVDNKKLEPTNGFFFGTLCPVTDEEYDDLKKDIKTMRDYLAEGYELYYYSWW